MRTKRERKSSIIQNEFFNENNMHQLQPFIELFTDFLVKNFNDELQTSQNLREVTDISMPDEWYPEARSIKRKVIYHMGPTNSGKTKHAIEALLQAK